MFERSFAICCCVILSSVYVMATSPQLSSSLPSEKDLGKMSDVVFQSLQNIVKYSQYPCEPESPSKRKLLLPPSPPSGGDSPCSPLCGTPVKENFSLSVAQQYWRIPVINDSGSFSSSDDSEMLVLPPNSGCGKCYGRNSDTCVFASDGEVSDGGLSTSSSDLLQTDSCCSDLLFSDSSVERSKSADSLNI